MYYIVQNDATRFRYVDVDICTDPELKIPLKTVKAIVKVDSVKEGQFVRLKRTDNPSMVTPDFEIVDIVNPYLPRELKVKDSE